MYFVNNDFYKSTFCETPSVTQNYIYKEFLKHCSHFKFSKCLFNDQYGLMIFKFLKTYYFLIFHRITLKIKTIFHFQNHTNISFNLPKISFINKIQNTIQMIYQQCFNYQDTNVCLFNNQIMCFIANDFINIVDLSQMHYTCIHISTLISPLIKKNYACMNNNVQKKYTLNRDTLYIQHHDKILILKKPYVIPLNLSMLTTNMKLNSQPFVLFQVAPNLISLLNLQTWKQIDFNIQSLKFFKFLHIKNFWVTQNHNLIIICRFINLFYTIYIINYLDEHNYQIGYLLNNVYSPTE